LTNRKLYIAVRDLGYCVKFSKGEILKKLLSLVFGIFVVTSIISLCGCIGGNNSQVAGNGNAKLSGVLKVSGSTTVLPIAKEAAKRYMMKNPNVQIEVSGGGSGFGVKQVGEGLVDIGMASRDLKPEEKQKYPDLVTHEIAYDGVAVVVHPSNPITGLTKEQVKKIFAGEITNWKEVGGKDAPINVYTRDEESGTREVFWEKALDKGEITKKAVVVNSNGAMKAAVSQDPNAIGFLSVGYVDNSVKAVKFDGIEPTEENVKNGKYKISRTLWLITKGEPSELEKAFIDYILSEEGQKIVKEKGYLPIK